MARFELPKLPYSFDALEPHIDAKTMEIHYTKHHQAYTDGLNKALDSIEGQEIPATIEEILKGLSKFPESVRSAINFHGGGFDNHTLFWNSMKQNGGGEPGGKIADAINAAFGSFSSFKEKFSKDTAVIQGSGWGWLVFNPRMMKAEFTTMPNQTSPRTIGLVPLLGLDVWEHAYYLKYQNKRADYITAWWNLINWDEVEKRLGSI